MEFVQMTLNDWMNIKNELEQELRNAAAGFVRIGYLLRRAEESEGYKNDGYDTLTEWAEDNYGLTPTQVSRFKAINKRYSIDGYSNQLLPEYANYGQSKLTEMLTLSEEGLEMVSPAMRRDDIREIKAFERQAPKEEPVQEWIKAFFAANAGLAWLENTKAYRDNDLQKLIEEINPTGTKTFRAGRTMVSMFKDKIMVRNFPDPVERMEWSEFFESVRKEFELRQREHISAESEHFDGHDEQISAETGISEQETDKNPVIEAKENKEPVTDQPEKQEKEIARAQLKETENPANNNGNSDSTIEEKVEQVEIEEILPAPTKPDRMRDLKDHFEEVLGTLRMMLDTGNYKGMDIPIDRLKALRAKMIEESIKEGEA